jgi:hypothetical protein
MQCSTPPSCAALQLLHFFGLIPLRRNRFAQFVGVAPLHADRSTFETGFLHRACPRPPPSVVVLAALKLLHPQPLLASAAAAAVSLKNSHTSPQTAVVFAMFRAVASVFQATQVRAFAAASATKSSPLAGLLARRRSKSNVASLRVRLTKVRFTPPDSMSDMPHISLN